MAQTFALTILLNKSTILLIIFTPEAMTKVISLLFKRCVHLSLTVCENVC